MTGWIWISNNYMTCRVEIKNDYISSKSANIVKWSWGKNVNVLKQYLNRRGKHSWIEYKD